MKVRIIASDFVLPIGTVLNVGNTPPKAWAGKYEIVDQLDHDGDGVKGGNWYKAPDDVETGASVSVNTPAPIEKPRKTR